VLAGGEQVSLQGAAEIARGLDGPDAIFVELDRPLEQALVAVIAGVDSELIEQLWGLAVDRGRGVGGPVGVHSDDHHGVEPLSCR
jgi:hypothetical protein